MKKKIMYFTFGSWGVIILLIGAMSVINNLQDNREIKEKSEYTHKANHTETINHSYSSSNERFFSGWDGSNAEFVDAVKNAMNDPKSFEHVETRYIDKGDSLEIHMKFRGKNGFNAMITSVATCLFNKETKEIADLEIIE